MNAKTERKVIEISDAQVREIKPVVSVVLVTYNHEDYLAQTIEGIVTQKTTFPFELIIGEDCSPDNTRLVAIEYQKKYPHIIRVITYEKNVGMNQNFVQVLSESRGKYIADCDGDDCWNDSQKLQKQVDFLENNTRYVVAFHDSVFMNKFAQGEKISVIPTGGHRDISSDELVHYAFMPTLSICFRNVLGELPEEFLKVMNPDTFLFSLLGSHGDAKYMADIQPGLYREHAGGVWSGLSPQKQSIGSATTCYWQMVYYNRINQHALANYFAFAGVDHILSVIKVSKKVLLKWFLMRYFSKTYQFLKKLKHTFTR